MKLYYTADPKIDPEFRFYSKESQLTYVDHLLMVFESIFRQHGKSINWWVSSPASRNTIASPLFHYCFCIASFPELIRKKEHLSEILTDSRAFKKYIEDYLVKQGVNTRVTLAR
jgi:hypothetical protein